MSKKVPETRGEQRFASVTYSQIADWTGLKLSTVRTYGAGRVFNPYSLRSVLEFVNRRRRVKGLPLIGEIPDDDDSEPEISPQPPALSAGGASGYNPRKGEFE